MNDTRTDLVNFFRRFSLLLDTGVPLLRALRTVQIETTSEQLKAVIQGIGANIESGHGLRTALAAYPGVFTPSILVMVESGETTGRLEEVLQEIAKRIEDGTLPADMTDLKPVVAGAGDHFNPIKRVSVMFFEAAQSRASDIHVEPTAKGGLRIRFRVDGVLHEKPEHAVPAEEGTTFISRIKIMANLNLQEKRRPQDGRIQVSITGKEFDIRVSVAPCVAGESIVMRVMTRPEGMPLTLDALGFTTDNQNILRKWYRKPSGLIIVTGPTGSGTTTTLYAMLKELNSPNVKIVTVEDPVEYQFDGICQMQIDPSQGVTHGQALRSALRQAANVIMIGEIRDLETARIAIQAALTGHLVLTSLHTNDTTGALRRLMDIGVAPFLVASAVAGILSHRLVRQICPDCREECATPEWASVAMNVKSFHSKGCTNCNQTGYRGRTGIHELLEMDNKMRELVFKDAGIDELRKLAVASGMIALREDGLAKVGQGITTIEEVLKYTGA